MLSFSSVRTGKGGGADNSARYSSPTHSPPVSPQSSPSKAHRLPTASRAPLQLADKEADVELCQRLTRTLPRPSQRSRFAHGVINDSSDDENYCANQRKQVSLTTETESVNSQAAVQLLDVENSLVSLISQLAIADTEQRSSSLSEQSKVSNSSVHQTTSVHSRSHGGSSFGTPASGFSEGWRPQYCTIQQHSLVYHEQLPDNHTLRLQQPAEPIENAIAEDVTNQFTIPVMVQEATEAIGSTPGSQPLAFARSHRRAATTRKPVVLSDSDEGSVLAPQQHNDSSNKESAGNPADTATNSRTVPASRNSARCSPSFSPVRRRHLTFADEHEQTYDEYNQLQYEAETYSLPPVDHYNHVDYHRLEYHEHPATVPDIEVVNLISDSSEEELQHSFEYHISQPAAEPWSCFKPAGQERTHYEGPYSSSSDANQQQDITSYDLLQHQALQELPQQYGNERHHSVWSASESDSDTEVQPTELSFSMHGAGRATGLAVPRTAGRATLPTTAGISSHKTPATTTNKTSLTAAPARRRTKTSATQKQFLANRQAIAQQLYDSWNQAVFGGRLPADLPLVWNPRLVSTAGQVLDDGTFNSLKTVKGQKIPCRLELSSKILTSLSRLRTTLAHEMCHVAAWALEQDYIAPHGDGFWLWADRLMSYDARQWDNRQQSSSLTSATPATTSQVWGKRKSGLGPLFTAAAAAATNMEHVISEQDEEDGPLVITRLHTFETHMPYRWQCTNTSCHKVYQRHRCSIDVERHVCSKCKGRLMYLGKFAKDGRLLAGGDAGSSSLMAEAGLHTPAKTPARKPTAYQQFVKEQYSIIKEQQPPGTPMPTIMKEVASLWTAHKKAVQQQELREALGTKAAVVEPIDSHQASYSNIEITENHIRDTTNLHYPDVLCSTTFTAPQSDRCRFVEGVNLDYATNVVFDEDLHHLMHHDDAMAVHSVEADVIDLELDELARRLRERAKRMPELATA